MATDTVGAGGGGAFSDHAAAYGGAHVSSPSGEFIDFEEATEDRNFAFYSADVTSQQSAFYIPPHWSWDGYEYGVAAEAAGADAVFAFDTDPIDSSSSSFLDTGSPQTTLGLNGVTSTSVVLNENPPSNNMLNKKSCAFIDLKF
mgnify:CR=1 FL=1